MPEVPSIIEYPAGEYYAIVAAPREFEPLSLVSHAANEIEATRYARVYLEQHPGGVAYVLRALRRLVNRSPLQLKRDGQRGGR